MTTIRSGILVFTLILLVAGRMPGIILLLETDGEEWQIGIARLSARCSLTVSLDENTVWSVTPSFGSSANPYFATNAPAVIPGTLGSN